VLEAVHWLRKRIIAYYDAMAPIIAHSFAETPFVYAAFPNGFTHDPTWHGPVGDDAGKDEKTIRRNAQKRHIPVPCINGRRSTRTCRHPKARDRRDECGTAPQEAVRALQAEGLSQREACSLVKCPCKTAQNRLRKPREDAQLREQLEALAAFRVSSLDDHAAARGHCGQLVENSPDLSGFALGSSAAPQAACALRSRPQWCPSPRRTSGGPSISLHDRLNFGRPFRAMVIVDDFRRKCLAVEVVFFVRQARRHPRQCAPQFKRWKREAKTAFHRPIGRNGRQRAYTRAA